MDTPTLSREYPVDSHGYIEFGSVCRNELHLQCQYGSHYLMGLGGSPNLSEGLDWHGGGDRYLPEVFQNMTDHGGNYHAIRITPESAATLVQRVRALDR